MPEKSVSDKMTQKVGVKADWSAVPHMGGNGEAFKVCRSIRWLRREAVANTGVLLEA